MIYTAGLGVGQMSGSIAGTTASRNRYGPYFRNRAVPVNPSTPLQTLVRAIFAALTNRWVVTLTQAQRDAWNVYAANILFKNPLGQDIYITGFNHYIRSNTVAARPNFPPIDDAPVIMTKADQDQTIVATASEATQIVSIAFDDTKAWCDEDEAGMQILMSRPVGASIGFIPPVFRYGDTFEGDGITPLTSPQTFTAPFPVAQNQQILCRGRIVRADGRLSDNFHNASSVTA